MFKRKKRGQQKLDGSFVMHIIVFINRVEPEELITR